MVFIRRGLKATSYLMEINLSLEKNLAYGDEEFYDNIVRLM